MKQFHANIRYQTARLMTQPLIASGLRMGHIFCNKLTKSVVLMYLQFGDLSWSNSSWIVLSCFDFLSESSKFADMKSSETIDSEVEGLNRRCDVFGIERTSFKELQTLLISTELSPTENSFFQYLKEGLSVMNYQIAKWGCDD